jgi:hypothetical protein
MNEAKIEIIGAVVQATGDKFAHALDNMAEHAKAAQDAITYGSGWIRVEADGTMHRMDPTRILVEYKLD